MISSKAVVDLMDEKDFYKLHWEAVAHAPLTGINAGIALTTKLYPHAISNILNSTYLVGEGGGLAEKMHGFRYILPYTILTLVNNPYFSQSQ